MSETEIIKLRLSDGTEIFAEVEEARRLAGQASTGTGGPREINFRQALDNVREAAGELVTMVRSIAVPPDECEVSFGIKLNAQAGAIIAKASAEANFTVKLSWTRPQT
jgi:hypothetical protein